MKEDFLWRFQIHLWKIEIFLQQKASIDELLLLQHDKGEWQVVFYLAAGIYLAGCVIFGLFASGHRQAWAEVPTGYMSQVDENSRDDL